MAIFPITGQYSPHQFLSVGQGDNSSLLFNAQSHASSCIWDHYQKISSSHLMVDRTGTCWTSIMCQGLFWTRDSV